RRQGKAGLRMIIDEMLESHHGRSLREWHELGEAGREILCVIASGKEPHDFRKRSIAVLGKLRDPAVLSYLSAILRNQKEGRILRMVAARSIGEIGTTAGVDELLENLNVNDLMVRHKVVEALGASADPRSVAALQRLAKDGQSGLVVEAARNALR